MEIICAVHCSALAEHLFLVGFGQSSDGMIVYGGSRIDAEIHIKLARRFAQLRSSPN